MFTQTLGNDSNSVTVAMQQNKERTITCFAAKSQSPMVGSYYKKDDTLTSDIMLDRFIFTFDGRSVKLIYTQKMMKGTNCMSLIPHFKNKYKLSLLLHILNYWWFAGEEILATCSFRHQFRHQNQTPSATHEVLCRVSERRMGPPESSSEQTTDCGAHLPSG